MRLARVLHAANAIQQAQRGALMPWSAVAFGTGVGLYFALPVEPGPAGYALAGLLAAFGVGMLAWRREELGPPGIVLALLAAGLCTAGWRAHQVAGPVLDFRYYGPIEGRIVGIDRSASDAIRLTLDQVRLDNVRDVPSRVRIALHDEQGFIALEPGAVVMTTGHLSAPGGAAEPGDFDFQRHAWFLSLGGTGYTRVPLLLLEPPAPRATPLFDLRMRMSRAIQAAIPGQPGAFAAAVLTGDRSGLEQGPTEDMRDANISHLLAISGLHMGLLTGFVYAAIRAILALIPALALRYPIRKWAAVAALASGAFYLALSGANVATERAFVQVAVMFTAVLLDRRAITLRSVAIAALIVLAHRPDTLVSPGFQMSFAATVALVAGFNAMRGATWSRAWPPWAKWLLGLVLSSLVAGLATAPFAAAHFNRVAVYGLAANLLTVPVMGSVVIPCAVLALVLLPFGLAPLAFWVMEQGLVWILAVAAVIADLPGAVDWVPSPPAPVLPLVAIGGLGLCLWQGRGRWLGLAPVLAGLALWQMAERPALLISETGGLVGHLTAEGRALSRARGDGFVAGIWLENDGDRVPQEVAAARAAWVPDGPGQSLALGPHSLWHGTGVTAARAAEAACAAHAIVVLNTPPEGIGPALDGAEARTLAALAGPDRVPGAAQAAASPATDAGCLLFSPQVLARTGAVSVTVTGDGLAFTTERARQGRRLWSRR